MHLAPGAICHPLLPECSGEEPATLPVLLDQLSDALLNGRRPGPDASSSAVIRPMTEADLDDVVDDALDRVGVDLTLPYSPLNPLPAPFWHLSGRRPLWSWWAVSPASRLRRGRPDNPAE